MELPEYITKLEKNGNTYYGLKLNMLSLNEPIVVEKIFPTTFEKQGIYGPFWSTTVQFNGLGVDILLSNAEMNNNWLALPLGLVSINKTVSEKLVKGKTKNGTIGNVKKTITRYEFKPASGFNTPKQSIVKPTFGNTPTILDQRQLNALRVMVQNGQSPDTQIMVDGQPTTYRAFIGDAVNNPSQYI